MTGTHDNSPYSCSGCWLLASLLLITTTASTVAITISDIEWKGQLKNLLVECKHSVQTMRNQNPAGRWKSFFACAEKKTFKTIDKIFDNRVVQLVNGVLLVKDGARDERTATSATTATGVSRSTPTRPEDERRLEPETSRKRNIFEKLSERVARVFETHAIKIDIDKMIGSDDPVEGRGKRRRKHGMMSMVMMGMMLMGSVLIPMGFQFLAVLGGKALIISKMALMLSSMQGLKRVAGSAYNYGAPSYVEGPQPSPPGYF